AEQKTAAEAKLIAFGVTAEVIVVVENEDVRFWPGVLAVEVGGGKSADSSSDDDEIVGFLIRSGIVPMLAIAEGVRYLPRTVVASAETRFCRRVIVRPCLWSRQCPSDAERFRPNSTRRS